MASGNPIWRKLGKSAFPQESLKWFNVHNGPKIYQIHPDIIWNTENYENENFEGENYEVTVYSKYNNAGEFVLIFWIASDPIYLGHYAQCYKEVKLRY